LCLGALNNTGYVVASESCALATIGADFIRDVRPGEIVRLDENGITSWQGPHQSERPAMCVFEFIYFARPDSILEGQSVHEVRRRLGARLAQEHPVDADLVIGVPDSATAHAIGYAQAAGLPFNEGLIKNRYIGRTFIQPNDRLRKRGVALKFNPLPDVLKGKRVIVVDDSIVRGTTSGPLMNLLRHGGAAEVHMRIASPPIRYPCYMGVDMSGKDELIAASLDAEAIRKRIGADSLYYLSVEGLLDAVGPGAGDHCLACFTGNYPVSTETATTKEAFEP